MQLQNNIESINTARNQKIVRGKMSKSLEKLSTGYKINRAGDNAAGLAISELMRNQINGLDQAIRNNNDGISLTNVGEGALQEVHSMLQRLKTLAVQAANETYDTVARGNIDTERAELLEELDRISQNTDFAGIPLFGSAEKDGVTVIAPPELKDNIDLQIGHSSQETMEVERYYMGSKELLLDSTDFTSRDAANESIQKIEDAIEAVSDVRASFGASNRHLQHTNNNISVTKENMTSAESNIRDTDMAEEITTFTAQNVILQSSNAMMTHSNHLPDLVLQLLQG